MRHDINKKKINILKRIGLSERLSTIVTEKKIVNKGSFILYRQQMVYSHHQIFSLS